MRGLRKGDFPERIINPGPCVWHPLYVWVRWYPRVGVEFNPPACLQMKDVMYLVPEMLRKSIESHRRTTPVCTQGKSCPSREMIEQGLTSYFSSDNN